MRLSCILWELFWENLRKESPFLCKRGELGHEEISCYNSRREDGLGTEGVRMESLAYKAGCTLFWISESLFTIWAWSKRITNFPCHLFSVAYFRYHIFYASLCGVPTGVITPGRTPSNITVRTYTFPKVFFFLLHLSDQKCHQCTKYHQNCS